MLDLESGTPLYEQIKEYILNNIQAGIFPTGGRIPSERTLSEKFGVSRLTVKRAIDRLSQEGVLYTRIGKGTYISVAKFDQQLEQLTSFTEEMQKRGKYAGSQVLSAETVPASDDDAQLLRVMTGSPLILLVRLRLANGVPMAIERTKLVAGLCRGLLDHHDFSRESLYQVLREEYGIHLQYAEQSIEARLATHEESRLLQVKTSAPILHMMRRTFTDLDQPIEYALSAYCGERYKFQAVLKHL